MDKPYTTSRGSRRTIAAARVLAARTDADAVRALRREIMPQLRGLWVELAGLSPEAVLSESAAADVIEVLALGLEAELGVDVPDWALGRIRTLDDFLQAGAVLTWAQRPAVAA